LQGDNDPGLVDIAKSYLGIGASRASSGHNGAEVEHDQDPGISLLGLFGLDMTPAEQVAAPKKTSGADDFKLCPSCEIEVARWTDLMAQQQEKDVNEEHRSRMVWDALACFASGALMGIVFGILRD